MFHLELRHFPHVARAFNLTRGELDARFARPWVSGTEVRYEERVWSPEKAKLTIYEGPALSVGEMGMGRGWANVGRTSKEVTEAVLAQAHRGPEDRSGLEMVKAALRGAARRPVRLPEVVALVVAECPRQRPSEQLATAEQAVWELLHQGQLALRRGDQVLDTRVWSDVVLDWSTWTGATGADVVLETPG